MPIHYLRTGSGPPVVLLHGASGNLRDWTLGALAAIAERHDVIAFDRPGLGFTGRPVAARPAAGAQAALLRDALARLGVERATLVGHSFGGAVALAWALDAPETVAGLLLLGAPSQPRGRPGLMTGLLANRLTGPLVARNVPARTANRLAAAASPASSSPRRRRGYLAHMRPSSSSTPPACAPAPGRSRA